MKDSSLNFVGNVEGNDLFSSEIDVVVCDGFTGNIVLKACEATAKAVAKWVKEEYSDRLKNLSMKEGKILVKLIYRETNLTSYEIVKSYRGRFNAFFWQTMAKFWKNDLKTIYDPDNIREDMFIENIIIHENLPEIFK